MMFKELLVNLERAGYPHNTEGLIRLVRELRISREEYVTLDEVVSALGLNSTDGAKYVIGYFGGSGTIRVDSYSEEVEVEVDFGEGEGRKSGNGSRMGREKLARDWNRDEHGRWIS
jgi:hypothetical protein